MSGASGGRSEQRVSRWTTRRQSLGDGQSLAHRFPHPLGLSSRLGSFWGRRVTSVGGRRSTYRRQQECGLYQCPAREREKAGVLTLAGDIGKGWLAGWVATLVLHQEAAILWVALASIIGHLHSAFLGLKGGKGVATALGAALGVAPGVGFTLMALWIGAVFLWKYSSGGALFAFGMFPIVALLFHRSWTFIGFACVVSVLIWMRHKDNLIRLWSGTESRIGQSS